ncbi:DUF1266 domain-containing protein [Lysobacter sp. TAB13]|uniref:DUF1266 domain-containing protein n=1 Tax=Lysobacter sp. TAB13 TaxID=3233065 RepID=UPI003F98CFA9
MNATPAAARDVINADKIRAAIARRSRGRHDHADIARWLQTHFFRWAINSFEHVLPVRSIEGWRTCIGEPSPPAWFLSKLAAAGAPMIYIDPEHHLLRDREARMVEFFHARLGSRLAGKFHRITFADAEAAWSKDHERMQRRSKRGWWPSQPHALAEVVATPHGRFVELRAIGQTLRGELAYESFHMQHCLGQFAQRDRLEGGYGEHYAHGCEQGRIRLFSLRDPNNGPHVTVSLIEDLGEWSLDQVKGKQNTIPDAKYASDVLCLLNAVRPRDIGSLDLSRLGIVAQNEGDEVAYVAFADLRDAARRHALLGAFPHLLAQHPQPDPFAQWLALAGGAAVVGEVAAPHGPVVAALHAMNAEEASVPNRARLSATLMEVFPQWLAPALAQETVAPKGGWLRRLLMGGGAAAANQTTPHRQWALAVPELLFYRLGVDGDSRRGRLAAPQGTGDRLRAQIESELGISDGETDAAIRTFCETFFRVPYLAHPMLVTAQQEPHETASKEDPQPDAARDLLAWHAMRQSHLLRLLVAWNLLDETRGWALLLLNAQRVRDCFLDWPDFGSAAARGHAIWLHWSGREAHRAKATQVALQDFQDEYDCAWKRLPWSAFDLAQAIAAHPIYATA